MVGRGVDSYDASRPRQQSGVPICIRPSREAGGSCRAVQFARLWAAKWRSREKPRGPSAGGGEEKESGRGGEARGGEGRKGGWILGCLAQRVRDGVAGSRLWGWWGCLS